MHIGDLDGATASVGRNWSASVIVAVHDINHEPVAGASVLGDWTDGFIGAGSCVTDDAGTCTIQTDTVSFKQTSVLFTVNDVVVTGYLYESVDNHDPETDSNGTSITIIKP
jgi:hypothetical protein